MLGFFRTRKSFKVLVTGFLLGSLSLSICQSCLAHAVNLSTQEPLTDKAHCLDDSESSSEPVLPNKSDCACHCDNLTASTDLTPQAILAEDPRVSLDPILIANNNIQYNSYHSVCSSPLPDPPERSYISPLERSCVQLK